MRHISIRYTPMRCTAVGGERLLTVASRERPLTVVGSAGVLLKAASP
jgi:hypothetical protein